MGLGGGSPKSKKSKQPRRVELEERATRRRRPDPLIPTEWRSSDFIYGVNLGDGEKPTIVRGIWRENRGLFTWCYGQLRRELN